MTAEKTWIQLHSGEKFYPLEPEVSKIHIEDIAHALSNLCRYGGHTSKFYSVAEHSVRISWRADSLAVTVGEVALAAAKWGLLHDAAEAYLGDMVRPLKVQPAFATAYKAAEARLMAAVAERFGLEGEEPDLIRELDTEILGAEARQLKAPVHPDWHKTTATGQLPEADWAGSLGWGPETARGFFLRRYRQLWSAGGGA